jgi:hypothetical protein
MSQMVDDTISSRLRACIYIPVRTFVNAEDQEQKFTGQGRLSWQGRQGSLAEFSRGKSDCNDLISVQRI